MNKENQIKYTLIIGELEENDLFYHKNNFIDLLQYANAVTCLSDETNQKVKDFFKKEKVIELITIKLSDFLNLKDQYEYIFFTGYLNTINEEINSDKKKIYYLLNDKLKVNDTLDLICENNFDKIISHLLPSELPKCVSENTYRFICSKLYHMPCPLVEKVELNSTQSKNHIFIYNKDSKNYQRFEKVYQELSKNKIITLLDIDDLNLTKFCSNNDVINNNSKIILLDVDANKRLFLINFCLANDLSISVNDESHSYDREIINLIDSGIVKSEINTDVSLRSRFNKFLNHDYSSFTRSGEFRINKLHIHFIDNLEYGICNNDFPLVIGNKYLQVLDTKINGIGSLLSNPLSYQPSDINDSLSFVSFLLEEQDDFEFSDIIFSRFYNILLERLLKEESNWYIYNTIIRFVHLRPNIYFGVLKTFCTKNKQSKKVEILLKLSVVSLSNIDLDHTTIINFLQFLKEFNKFDSLILYLCATSGLENREYLEKFDRSTISHSIFDLVSFNLILNESQIKFIKEEIETGSNFEVSNINDIYTNFVKGLVENDPIDFNLIRSNNATLYKLFNNNPYHLFRLFTTAWINNNNEIAYELLNHFDPKLFDKNHFFKIMYRSILQLAQKPIPINLNEVNFYINQHYNQIRKIFHLKVLSYNNDINFDFNNLFDAHKFKFLPKINNILNNHFS